jgi:hypothetical protein
VPFVFGLQFCGGYCSANVIMAKHRPCVVSFLHCIGSVPLYVYPILTLLLNQELWGEIGQDKMERDVMILQLEENCLNVYTKRWTERGNGAAGGARQPSEASAPCAR